jgi:hypothetical protein
LGLRASTRLKTRPSSTGARPLRTVSTSGNSGMIALQNYNLADKDRS